MPDTSDRAGRLRRGPATVDTRAVVLLMHGGAEHGAEPVDRRSAALWRMRAMFGSIRGRLAAEGCATALLRFTVRGWNAGRAAEPSPVTDARWALHRLRAEHPGAPVVLLGHSMGARTALHVADDPAVVGVVGLAPWFPAHDDVSTLAGVHLVAAHGSRDRVTSAHQTRLLLERADGVAASTRFVPMGPLGHYMLTRVDRWNRTAVRECLRVLEAFPDGRPNS